MFPASEMPGTVCLAPRTKTLTEEKTTTNELMSVTWVVALTAVMWMPYAMNAIMVGGIMDAVGYPEEPISRSA